MGTCTSSMGLYMAYVCAEISGASPTESDHVTACGAATVTTVAAQAQAQSNAQMTSLFAAFVKSGASETRGVLNLGAVVGALVMGVGVALM